MAITYVPNKINKIVLIDNVDKIKHLFPVRLTIAVDTELPKHIRTANKTCTNNNM